MEKNEDGKKDGHQDGEEKSLKIFTSSLWTYYITIGHEDIEIRK